MKQTLKVEIKTTNKQWDHRKFYFNGGKFITIFEKKKKPTNTAK